MRTMTALGMICLAALALSVIPAPDAAAEASDRMKPAVSLGAEPFPLSAVRLLDGPFRHAQELDRRYLLSLDPDRLLHNFRVNAGLPSSAQPYGGWEAPDCEVRGHFTGHYLSACAEMVAATGDAELKRRAEHMVAELAKCQAALKNGYLSAYPESFIDRVEALQRVWAPWYTLHKIHAGLLDVYRLCGDRQALEVARRFALWAQGRADRLTDEQMQKMLGNEHGGINESLANLAGLTGDRQFLALAHRFNHRLVLDPLARHEDTLTGLHANTQIPKFIGAARQYELGGEPWLREAARTFWEVVTRERSYVIGGHSDGEAFSPKERLSQYLGPNTTETCNTFNMLRLTRHLFCWEPRAEYADYYERALYNHILASQNPETGMMCYYVPLRSGMEKTYNTPTDSFWCCTGTGVENHATYGASIYFHDGAKSLYVNLFIPSTLDWRARGVTVRQETRFPEQGSTRLTFTCARPARFALQVRHPSWAGEGYEVRVNGKPVSDAGKPGSYAAVTRTWKTGDVVEVALPMALHTEAFRDNANRLAFLYGPIVLCAAVEPNGNYPAVVTADGALAGVIPVAGQPLTFAGSAAAFRRVGDPAGTPVTLTPFYKMHGRHYMVYWDLFTPAAWEAKQDEYRAEQQRLKELEARTVDWVRPGEEQSERDHSLASERSASGDYEGRKWRDARDGGWFSYRVGVRPGAAQELLCTYWGSDGGGREFDVLVDGARVATQRLEGNRPGMFYEEGYVLPPAAVAGKESVIVRFQAHPGRMAGGLFGLRVVTPR